METNGKQWDDDDDGDHTYHLPITYQPWPLTGGRERDQISTKIHSENYAKAELICKDSQWLWMNRQRLASEDPQRSLEAKHMQSVPTNSTGAHSTDYL